MVECYLYINFMFIFWQKYNWFFSIDFYSITDELTSKQLLNITS